MISIGGVVGQGKVFNGWGFERDNLVDIYNYCFRGCIGLFLSSGANLAKAGPAGLLIAYVIIGFIVYWVAVELGEMAAYIPVKYY